MNHHPPPQAHRADVEHFPIDVPPMTRQAIATSSHRSPYPHRTQCEVPFQHLSQSRLVIQLDGAQHAERAQRDEWRSALLARHGYRVLRFWNEEIINNRKELLEPILAELRRDLR
jgi:hypothetical protein